MDTIKLPAREDLPGYVTLTRDDLWQLLNNARETNESCQYAVERLKDTKNDVLEGYHRGMNLGVVSMIAHLCVKAALSYDWTGDEMTVRGEQTILARRHPAERELAELKAALVEAAQAIRDEAMGDGRSMEAFSAKGYDKKADQFRCVAAGELWSLRTLASVADRHGFADLNEVAL